MSFGNVFRGPCGWRARGGRAIIRALLSHLSRSREGRLHRVVRKALALTPRAFVPHDVLFLSELSARLRVEWRARDLHPWERGLPSERHPALLREQALRDTDAAILRLFHVLPDVEAVDVRVLEPLEPHRLLLAGTVTRADVCATRSIASPGMRLRMMGVTPA